MRFEILIAGMLSVHAKHAVFTALGAVDGVAGAEVELGRALVTHDGRVTEGALCDAIAAAGFDVTAVRTLPRTLPTI